MKTPIKLLIVAALAVTVGAVVVFKQGKPARDSGPSASAAPVNVVVTETTNSTPVATAKLPRLIDLGADKCIPCKMMAPILVEFKRDYADWFSTEFIDVWQNPEAGKQYRVEMIPTQIFFDGEGKELFRHVGFYGKDDILAKWQELGVYRIKQK